MRHPKRPEISAAASRTACAALEFQSAEKLS